MKSVLIVGMVMVALVAVPGLATAHHDGWDCKGDSDLVEACTPKGTLYFPDCYVRVAILGNQLPAICVD